MTRYVQHIYGQGNLWKLDHEWYRLYQDRTACPHWQIIDDDGNTFRLPKSEYREVPAPERWVDVTAETQEVEHTLVYRNEKDGCLTLSFHPSVFRLRKVQVYTKEASNRVPSGLDWHSQWAFIVEKKESV